MPAHEKIPADVLFDIFTMLTQTPDASLLGARATTQSWLQATCPQARVLLNVNLVNHAWHATAQPLIDKTIDLVLSQTRESRNLDVLARIQSEPGLQSRVRHLVVRDVHTQQRAPRGISDMDLDDDFYDNEDGAPPAELAFFAPDYVLPEIPEASLQKQLAAVHSAIASAALHTFTWAAVTPIPAALVEVLASHDTEVHLELNPRAVDIAAWSWMPVLSAAGVARLSPIAGRLRSLHVLLPHAGSPGCQTLLLTLDGFVSNCPKLSHLHVRALGRSCVLSLPFNDPLRTGINGPTQAMAQCAKTADFNAWQTGQFAPRPVTMPEQFWTKPPKSFSSPCQLTSLSLRNVCICDSQEDMVCLPHIPTLRSLTVSCLRLFKTMAGMLPKLRRLCLVMREYWTEAGEIEADSFTFSATCTEIWPQHEMDALLLKLPPHRELEVWGHPEAVSEVAFRHHGQSLRRLVLLHHEPYGREVAYDWTLNQFAPGPFRMHQLTDFLAMLGAACPVLTSLACDAPNATTEFDAFLNALAKTMRRLRYLHIRRSLEPYANSILATHFSFARFTTTSTNLVWSRVRPQLPLLNELKITIGRMSLWDDCKESTTIAPSAESRTFVMQRATSDAKAGSGASDDVICLEQREAQAALREGLPGPLMDYWDRQASLIDEFVEDRNVPVYPEQLLQDGLETRYYASRLPSEGDEAERSRKQEDFDAARSLQHQAEVAEAAHPTRQYY